MTDEEMPLIAKIDLFRDADHIDVFAIADALRDRGYAVEFITNPEADEPNFYIERKDAVKTGLEDDNGD